MITIPMWTNIGFYFYRIFKMTNNNDKNNFIKLKMINENFKLLKNNYTHNNILS